MDKISVSSHFVVAALSGARQKGYDVQDILQRANISAELLSNPRARVSGKQYTQLMQTIWMILQDEFMGFAEQRSKPGTFATLCYLAIRSNTLEGVFRRAGAFYSLFEKSITPTLHIENDTASLIINFETSIQDPYHFLQESLLVIWHRLACWLTGHQIILETSFFNYPPPEHLREYHYLFNSPLAFDQPCTGISFNKRYLSLPVIRDEQALKKFLETSPADLLAKPDDSNTFAAKIRAIIGRDFSEVFPDFDGVAHQINVSPQTLRRRLKAENTSYQEIKDNMRRDLAIYHLGRNELSINEIAHRVGFTEPSTFHRAFKKWTGVTPGAYRSGEGREVK